ncbi:MAG TPA: transporter substrate-binding domain-containing protein [Phototrophicaceae bacterium]|nr:transporter substrate-binding domain-containing protein [Phototrophicaceae bacterium]
MKRNAWLLAAVLSLLLLASSLVVVAAPPEQGAPTLVPPTLVPTNPPTEAALPSQSGLATIVQNGVVRIGVLYNDPPFGVFDIRGQETGFDADLGQAIADAWGVKAEFHQVTPQNGIDMVVNGDIDLLIAAQPHTRQLDGEVEFSQSYYPAYEALVVRQGDGATALAHMQGRKVGVVLGTMGEDAVNYWTSHVTYQFQVSRYLTLDQALTDLNQSVIDGVVDNQITLAQVINGDQERFVDEPVMPIPYAIAMRRQDVNLRDLVNKTLQFLYSSGKLNDIHQKDMNGAAYPGQSFVVWDNVGTNAPKPSDFGTDVPFPQQYVVPHLQSDKQLRVAGLADLPADAPESQRRLDTANRALINAIAQRWQVTVVPVPANGQNPLDQVASGAADLAVGVTPDWNSASKVDFTSYYLIHGLRLMVRTKDGYSGFGDLRGKVIGIFPDDAGVQDQIKANADKVNAVIDKTFTITPESDAGYTLLTDNNADVVFGDSLKLIPNVEANPNDLELVTNADGTAKWYTREFVGLAVPRNDINFYLLTEYTLQELTRDGTMAKILAPVMNAADIPSLDIWPGPGSYLGFNLNGNVG